VWCQATFFKRKSELARLAGLAVALPSCFKRSGPALTTLAGVLLAVTLGALPASASPVLGGEHGTAAFTIQPAQPPGLNAHAVSSSEVALSWTGSRIGKVPGYSVYDAPSSHGETGPVNPATVNGTTFPVTGLTPGTTYYFEVAYAAGSGTGSFGEFSTGT